METDTLQNAKIAALADAVDSVSSDDPESGAALVDPTPTVQPVESKHTTGGKLNIIKKRYKNLPEFHPSKGSNRLRILGFDPMEKMVILYDRINKEIEETKESPYVGVRATLPTLYSIQQKLINDLMRYKYSRVPESVEIKTPNLTPIQINLMPAGSSVSASEFNIFDNDSTPKTLEKDKSDESQE